MPIAEADIKFLLSGGAANADVDLSIGGAVSSVELVDSASHNLFDIVDEDETAAGDVEYRCIYVKNTHASLTWQNAKFWLVSNTGNAETAAAIGLGASAIGGVEAVPADEDTAPAGVTFSAPSTKSGGLVVGNLAPGETKAIWFRRTVNSGSSAFNNDTFDFRIEGATGA